MTEYKKITQKQIWVIMKVYSGGLVELINAYWDEHIARTAAAQLLPQASDTFAIKLYNVALHGHMVDRV